MGPSEGRLSSINAGMLQQQCQIDLFEMSRICLVALRTMDLWYVILYEVFVYANEVSAYS